MTSQANSKESPQPIRVLVASLTGTFAQPVLQAIGAEPDIQLVGQVQGQIDLLLGVAEGVDVLVLYSPRGVQLPGICTHLLAEFPDLRIIVLAPEKHAARLYWLGLRQQRIKDATAEELLASIRHAYALNPTI